MEEDHYTLYDPNNVKQVTLEDYQKMRDALEEIASKEARGMDYKQLAMDLQEIAQQALDELGELENDEGDGEV